MAVGARARQHEYEPVADYRGHFTSSGRRSRPAPRSWTGSSGLSSGKELLQVPPNDELAPALHHDREREIVSRLVFSLRVMLTLVRRSS
jgi:hypothetical protein